jgi:hypothetical protein
MVLLNMLQKKAIFETFSSFHCSEHKCLDCIDFIFPHTLLICLQIEPLTKYANKKKIIKKSKPIETL